MCAMSGDSDVLTMIRSGQPETLDALVSLLYDELRAAAHRQLKARRRSADGTPTLGTTALVSEAYLKLVDQGRATWEDRSHFLSLAAVAMRHILVDRARARTAAKRGGQRRRVTLDDDALAVDEQADVILAVDDALEFVQKFNPRFVRVVEARFFAGFTEDEAAQALGITRRTVQRDWKKARMLLKHALDG